MKLKSPFLMILFLMGIINASAQTDTIPPANSSIVSDSTMAMKNSAEKIVKQKPAGNFIKLNLFGIALKNYQLQYERALNRKFSFAIALRVMPVTSIPFNKQIIKIGEMDGQTKDLFENFRVGNFAITPEFRFYLSKKGYGRGFYIAPFYRYVSFTASNMLFNFDNDAGDESSVTLSGKHTSNTAGILLGVQKMVGKHILLDWWLLGPHYGTGTGNFTGVPDKTLSPAEQENLKSQMEDIDIPFTDETVNVTSNSASLKFDGPWAGLRMGLSIGVRF